MMELGIFAKTFNRNSILEEAFELIGDSIIIAHAKDVSGDEAQEFTAAGQGIVDYDFYLHLLQSVSFQGALIVHGLGEHQVEESLNFIRKKLQL